MSNRNIHNINDEFDITASEQNLKIFKIELAGHIYKFPENYLQWFMTFL